MTPSRTLRLTTLALLLLSPCVARAQGPVDREAEAQFQLALDAAKHGRSEEARMRFQESYAIDPQPGTLRGLALAEAALPPFRVQALRHLREWLRGPKVALAERERANKIIADLLSQTGHITVEGIPSASVAIDGGDPSKVTEDNGVFDVLPGHHTLQTTRDSGVQTREVDVAAGTTTRVRFEGAPVITAAPPPALAPVATSSSPASPPPTGTKDSIASRPATFWTPRTIAAVSLGGAAVVAFGVAAGFGVGAHGRSDDISTFRVSCPTGCSALDQAIHSQRQDALIADVFYASSAVLAAASIGVLTSLLVSPEGRPAERAAIGPMFLSGGAGVSVDGRF